MQLGGGLIIYVLSVIQINYGVKKIARGEHAMNQRQKRIWLIVQALKEAGKKGLSVERLSAVQAIEWGCTPVKVKEYIENIVNAGLGFVNNGVVYDVEVKE